MTETPTVVIRYKEVEHDEPFERALERRVHELTEEFPELTRFEITLEQEGVGFRMHGHAHAKHLEVTTHGDGPDLRTAADQLFHRAKQQLRRAHDKKIFQHRREAQKASPKN